ncbi:hypothetical protein LOK49_LG13G01257 [Camellia lanceoleosa]|uniref:Uncharacterized protein n=1 Tax=Camellia lanceoleosa TaxID=1840588 RepID=A0ACC0FIW7_9ERIC|nr:hypothetical protein LOK49_LG13G01257 [Camellia lanceoleosa]
MSFPKSLTILFPLLFTLLIPFTNATTFAVLNKCTYTIWAAAKPGGGMRLDPGQSWTVNVPPSITQARIWGQTNCNFDANGNGQCQTGDCNGLLQCQGYGKAPNTLAEFALNQPNNLDFVDISLVDGFNIPMDFNPTTAVCKSLRCAANIFGECPTELQTPVSVEKSITDISHVVLKSILCDGDLISHGEVAKDWESPELVHLLSQLSLSSDSIRCKYLLEVLDTLRDNCSSDKVTGQCILNSPGGSRIFKSSFLSSFCGVRWMVSSMDNELHYSKDLFYDCDAVRSILGVTAPYVVPKVKSEKLLCDIGLKTQVRLDDILVALQVWRRSKTPFMASIAQMSKFYTFIWNEMATLKQKIIEELSMGPFIFVPYSCVSRHDDVVTGVFLSPSEWRSEAMQTVDGGQLIKLSTVEDDLRSGREKSGFRWRSEATQR